MPNASDTLQNTDIEEENFDLDKWVMQLENQLSNQLSDLELMEADRKTIGSPESLGRVIEETIMLQVNNQISIISSEDFIKKNGDLTFDPRNSAHIQTTENFKDGKIAAHNTKINYQKRYAEQKANFQKNEDGSTKMQFNSRSQTYKEVLTKDARKPFDEGRDTGSAAVHKDHTISAAEIIRDPAANAHLSREEQIEFANSSTNLKDMDSRANQSKGDSTMSEWLNSEHDGKKPAERFDINAEQCMEDDRSTRKEYKTQKEGGEKKSIETGKQSQKEEVVRMTSSAGRAAAAQFVIACLKDLVLEIIKGMIAWFKSAQKNVGTFLDSLKTSFHSFAIKLKSGLFSHLEIAGAGFITTIVGAIFKPIGDIIKKFGTMIRQGFKSFKEAINYLRNPANKDQPFSIKVAQIGKIVITGLTAAGAIALGGVIEAGLTSIPVVGQILSYPIPLVGSLASIIGLFMGALASGLVGAMLLNFIDHFIANRLRDETTKQQISKGNIVLKTSQLLLAARDEKLKNTKTRVESTIMARHEYASALMKDSWENILENDKKIAKLEDSAQKNIALSDHEDVFNDISRKLKGI